MFSSNCCFLTCIQISQEAGQVVWYSHLFQNFPQFIVIHTVKGFGIVNKAEIDIFLELSFSMIQRMLAIWSGAGSQREELHPWQRSWGRRLGICKGGIEPHESPWKFSSIYPQPESAYFLLCALTYTSDFTGGWPSLPFSEKRVNLQAPVNKVPGCDSVSTYKLLWKSSILPE